MQNVINALNAGNANAAMQCWCADEIENTNSVTFDADYVADAVLGVIGINDITDSYEPGYEYLLPIAAGALQCILNGQFNAATLLANNIYNQLPKN